MKSNIRTTVAVSILGAEFHGKLKFDDKGVKLNDKQNWGYFVNGQIGWTVPTTLPETITITVAGQPVECRLKRDDNGQVTFSDNGNVGWRATGKADFDGEKHQIGINVTICKCGGKLPAVGTVAKLQIGGNITRYVPKSKTNKTLNAAQTAAPTIVAPPAPKQQQLPAGKMPIGELFAEYRKMTGEDIPGSWTVEQIQGEVEELRQFPQVWAR